MRIDEHLAAVRLHARIADQAVRDFETMGGRRDAEKLARHLDHALRRARLLLDEVRERDEALLRPVSGSAARVARNEVLSSRPGDADDVLFPGPRA